MKSTIFTFSLTLILGVLGAQTETDTTVYMVADVMPFPLVNNCIPERNPQWNGSPDSTRRCAESHLFAILAQNIRYPIEARDNNVQGTVVVSCIIEPQTGKMSQMQLLRDIGSGCGAEALRVLNALQAAGMRWSPGMVDGKPVRVKHALPIRFRLQEALPYYVSVEGDTVYTQYQKLPDFVGGVDSLLLFLVNALDYPSTWKDSCKTGVIEMETLVQTDGSIRVLNQLDFSDLGMDFQFEALRLTRRSAGLWIPAEYDDKPVNCTLPLRVIFKSEQKKCATANANFDRAMLLADEGANLLEAEKVDEAIQKWDEAIALQPNNCELLYYRGTARMNQNKREEACQDYNRVKQILGLTWFEDIRRLVCGN